MMDFSYKLPLINYLFLTVISFNFKYQAKVSKPWLNNPYQLTQNSGTLWWSVLVFKSNIHQTKIVKELSTCQSGDYNLEEREEHRW